MEHGEEYYWIKTEKYGWEIARRGYDVSSPFYDVINDGGMVYAEDVIQAIRIPYPDEEDKNV